MSSAGYPTVYGFVSTGKTAANNAVADITSGYIDSTLTLNPSIVPITDANGHLASSSTPSNVLPYLNNVTSDIQTQINNKEPTFSTCISSDQNICSSGESRFFIIELCLYISCEIV